MSHGALQGPRLVREGLRDAREYVLRQLLRARVRVADAAGQLRQRDQPHVQRQRAERVAHDLAHLLARPLLALALLRRLSRAQPQVPERVSCG